MAGWNFGVAVGLTVLVAQVGIRYVGDAVCADLSADYVVDQGGRDLQV